MGASEDFINKEDEFEVEDDVPLPGFRFHPTDEELVSFYLRRKLDKKPISIELIKQIDIYKYDPWDLPKASGTGGDKEGYFFCKRGRKYRNSIRPNRVTCSGFWKATGIDKPIYSHGGEGSDCIGLKKTLVYYRGSAGKGTKTDWMMHEFRLPSGNDTNTNINANTKNSAAENIAQEAEIWTLCRIFKRNVSPRKHTPDMRQLAAKRTYSTHDKSITRISSTMECNNTNQESYINFGASLGNIHNHYQNEQKPVINYNTCSIIDQRNNNNHQFHNHHVGQFNPPVVVAQEQQQQQQQQPPHQMTMTTAPSSNLWINPAATNCNDLFAFENWDELGSVVKFAVDSPSL